MAKSGEMPADWREQLQDEEERIAVSKVSARYKQLATEANAIPLRAKSQYPIYVEARTLHLMRGVAKTEEISIQELIRTAIQEALDKRMRVQKKPPKRSSKRTPKKTS